MKRKLFNSILLLLAVMAALPASGYDFMVDGLCYNINSDGTTVSITSRFSTTNSAGTYPSTIGNTLVIPSSVSYSGKTYIVNRIDAYAFYRCQFLTSVSIPNSITNARQTLQLNRSTPRLRVLEGL